MRRFLIVLVVSCVAAAGCANKEATVGAEAGVSGEENKPGSSLAYEHTVHIALPGQRIEERMQATRAACLDQRFGACTLLSFEQDAGENATGSLMLRVLPAAVEPLTALAGEGGEFGSRLTRADDLAEAVADTTSQIERLQLNREKLLQLQVRADLSVADALNIARELAAIESSLQAYERSAADQARRIETNLLTLRFTTGDSTSRWSRLRETLTGSLDTVVDGIANAIEVVAYVLPLLFVAFPAALLWRYFWRRSTRRWAEKSRE
jgi:hypothetical protein